jgi:hypothetical protein
MMVKMNLRARPSDFLWHFLTKRVLSKSMIQMSQCLQQLGSLGSLQDLGDMHKQRKGVPLMTWLQERKQRISGH